jgi:hypothetical protein
MHSAWHWDPASCLSLSLLPRSSLLSPIQIPVFETLKFIFPELIVVFFKEKYIIILFRFFAVDLRYKRKSDDARWDADPHSFAS